MYYFLSNNPAKYLERETNFCLAQCKCVCDSRGVTRAFFGAEVGANCDQRFPSDFFSRRDKTDEGKKQCPKPEKPTWKNYMFAISVTFSPEFPKGKKNGTRFRRKILVFP